MHHVIDSSGIAQRHDHAIPIVIEHVSIPQNGPFSRHTKVKDLSQCKLEFHFSWNYLKMSCGGPLEFHGCGVWYVFKVAFRFLIIKIKIKDQRSKGLNILEREAAIHLFVIDYHLEH